MKRLITTVCALFCICGVGAFDVKEFGAKGDGKTDDTAAIQKALRHIAKRIKYDRFRQEDGWNGGGTETHVDELFFPEGTYVISRTLLADGSVSLRGVRNKSIIKMTDPKQDVFYCRVYRRLLVDGMTFDGGFTQIDVWSGNWNASSVHITRTVFKNAAAPAFRNVSRRVKRKKVDWSVGLAKLIKSDVIKMIPTHEVTFEGETPVLKRSSQANSISWFSSNIISIRECEFLNCARAFENNADGTLMENCTVTASPGAEGPVCLVRTGSAPNMLTMKNCTFLAHATTKKQLWFKNDGFYFTLRNCRFEAQQPMPLLEQETAKIPPSSTAGNILIAGCVFEQKGTPPPQVILKRVPSYFLFRGNRFKGETPRLFDWAVKDLDEKYLQRDSFAGKHQGVPWALENKYQFIFARNENVDINCTEILRRFIHKEVPRLHTVPETMPEIADVFKGELRAADFGVRADGKTDDADSLERAMAAAAKQNKTLIIPTGRIRAARTVKLPPRISLRGEGMPVIGGDTRSGYDLFEAEEPEDIRFRGLILRNGRHILKAKLGTKSKIVSFRDVLIVDTDRLSILLEGKENNCLLELVGSLWNGAGGIDSSARYNAVSLCWFANNFWMDDMAFFTARRGTTVMQNGFFVPYIAKNIKRTNRKTGESKLWPLGGDLRWVDNAGSRVFMYDCRGGGEAGGYCSCYHTAPGGFDVIEGGLARMTYKYTKNAIVYAAAAPDWVLVSAVGGYPIHTVLGVRHRVWMKADGVGDFPVYILGSMTPQKGPEKKNGK